MLIFPFETEMHILQIATGKKKEKKKKEKRLQAFFK